VEQRNWLQRLFGRFFGRRAGLTQVKVMAGYTPIFTPGANGRMRLMLSGPP